MRNAAMVLGLIAGLMGIFVGLFGFGYSELAAARPEGQAHHTRHEGQRAGSGDRAGR